MPSNVSQRCFPPPRTIEEHAESFIVKDATGQALGISISRRSRSAAQADVRL